jgi:hypothetical protein
MPVDVSATSEQALPQLPSELNVKPGGSDPEEDHV